MKTMINCILLIFLFMPTIAATPFDEATIAILDFEGAGLQNSAIIMASDKFRASFIETSKYGVMERASMNDLFKEQGFQQTGAFTWKYCSHYKKSHLSRSGIELNYFQHRKSEDLVWATSAAVTSLTMRLLTSYLTAKKDFE